MTKQLKKVLTSTRRGAIQIVGDIRCALITDKDGVFFEKEIKAITPDGLDFTDTIEFLFEKQELVKLKKSLGSETFVIERDGDAISIKNNGFEISPLSICEDPDQFAIRFPKGNMMAYGALPKSVIDAKPFVGKVGGAIDHICLDSRGVTATNGHSLFHSEEEYLKDDLSLLLPVKTLVDTKMPNLFFCSERAELHREDGIIIKWIPDSSVYPDYGRILNQYEQDKDRALPFGHFAAHHEMVAAREEHLIIEQEGNIISLLSEEDDPKKRGKVFKKFRVKSEDSFRLRYNPKLYKIGKSRTTLYLPKDRLVVEKPVGFESESGLVIVMPYIES